MNEPAPIDPQQLIGRRFAKTFRLDGGPQIFEGTVTAYTSDGLSGGTWTCSYDDGDEEEMRLQDLVQCLIHNGVR